MFEGKETNPGNMMSIYPSSISQEMYFFFCKCVFFTIFPIAQDTIGLTLSFMLESG